ncbi:MAG: hypothetical protein ACJ8GN_21350 [Longimicrobiaceae bacterium]
MPERAVFYKGHGLGNDGLETRRWNGTKSAFADCTRGFVAPRQWVSF